MNRRSLRQRDGREEGVMAAAAAERFLRKGQSRERAKEPWEHPRMTSENPQLGGEGGWPKSR